MSIRSSASRKAFVAFNLLGLALLAILCLAPFVHLLALSLSSNLSAASGEVGLLPVQPTLEAYRFLLQKPDFFRAAGVSLLRVLVGTLINMGIIILTAYPLSKPTARFKKRTFYVWFFAITMFFSGGLIPSYMVIRALGLLDSFWVFILPGALSVWNVIMLLNFFRGVPVDLEEAAIVDGASQLQVLVRVFLPVSLPALATLTLFTAVGHWNAWFDGVMYINTPAKYPLQTYLSTIVLDQNMAMLSSMSLEQLERLKAVSDKSLKAAQIFLGALPIMLVYPSLQRYFVKGLTLGSLKG